MFKNYTYDGSLKQKAAKKAADSSNKTGAGYDEFENVLQQQAHVLKDDPDARYNAGIALGDPESADIRIVALGYAQSGNSSLMLRLFYDEYDDEPEDNTLLQWDQHQMNYTFSDAHGYNEVLRISYFDLKGFDDILSKSEMSQRIADVINHSFNVILLYYSIDNSTSFEDYNGYSVQDIKAIVDQYLQLIDSSKFMVLLVGLKLDEDDDREVSTTQGTNLAKSWGDVPFIEVSAKTGENAKELLDIISTIYTRTFDVIDGDLNDAAAFDEDTFTQKTIIQEDEEYEEYKAPEPQDISPRYSVITDDRTDDNDDRDNVEKVKVEQRKEQEKKPKKKKSILEKFGHLNIDPKKLKVGAAPTQSKPKPKKRDDAFDHTATLNKATQIKKKRRKRSRKRVDLDKVGGTAKPWHRDTDQAKGEKREIKNKNAAIDGIKEKEKIDKKEKEPKVDDKDTTKESKTETQKQDKKSDKKKKSEPQKTLKKDKKHKKAKQIETIPIKHKEHEIKIKTKDKKKKKKDVTPKKKDITPKKKDITQKKKTDITPKKKDIIYIITPKKSKKREKIEAKPKKIETKPKSTKEDKMRKSKTEKIKSKKGKTPTKSKKATTPTPTSKYKKADITKKKKVAIKWDEDDEPKQKPKKEKKKKLKPKQSASEKKPDKKKKKQRTEKKPFDREIKRVKYVPPDTSHDDDDDNTNKDNKAESPDIKDAQPPLVSSPKRDTDTTTLVAGNLIIDERIDDDNDDIDENKADKEETEIQTDEEPIEKGKKDDKALISTDVEPLKDKEIETKEDKPKEDKPKDHDIEIESTTNESEIKDKEIETVDDMKVIDDDKPPSPIPDDDDDDDNAPQELEVKPVKRLRKKTVVVPPVYQQLVQAPKRSRPRNAGFSKKTMSVSEFKSVPLNVLIESDDKVLDNYDISKKICKFYDGQFGDKDTVCMVSEAGKQPAISYWVKGDYVRKEKNINGKHVLVYRACRHRECKQPKVSRNEFEKFVKRISIEYEGSSVNKICDMMDEKYGAGCHYARSTSKRASYDIYSRFSDKYDCGFKLPSGSYIIAWRR